jgi:hypothetical protein
MKNLIPKAVLTLALLGLTPLMRAEDSDKDVDAALDQANDAAKKMGMKMPDVKQIMADSDKEEAKEKAAKQAVVDAPGPAKLPKWTPKVPQFTASGPVAKKLIEGEPKVALSGTSPLTPAELADAWEKEVATQPRAQQHQRQWYHHSDCLPVHADEPPRRSATRGAAGTRRENHPCYCHVSPPRAGDRRQGLA